MGESKKDASMRAATLAVLIDRVAVERKNVSLRVEQAFALLALARQHGGIQVARCNRPITSRDEKREERIEAKITALLATINPAITSSFDGDPRGYTVKIHFPAVDGRKPQNTWGGAETGWGI